MEVSKKGWGVGDCAYGSDGLKFNEIAVRNEGLVCPPVEDNGNKVNMSVKYEKH